MISGHDIYAVVVAVVPLYVAMILAYASVKWWKIFTPNQCSGINKFVATFAVPLLGFHFIAKNNVYDMNLRFLAVDTLQKAVILLVLLLFNFSRFGNLDWSITIYSISALPNVLLVGLPLLKAMYGDFSTSLMVQIIVLQGLIWSSLLLIMYEYRAVKVLICKRFSPDEVRAITSVEENLQAHKDIRRDGQLSTRVTRLKNLSMSSDSTDLRQTDYEDMEMYSLSSSRVEENLKSQSLKDAIVSPMSSKRISDIQKDNEYVISSKHKATRSMTDEFMNGSINSSSNSIYGSVTSDMENIVLEINSLAATENSSMQTKKLEEQMNDDHAMPPATVVAKLIITTTWRKLISNPNIYGSVIGLIWSLISFRWNVPIPKLIDDSITILSRTGLGMSMFSLGLFIASQPKILTCRKRELFMSMAIRFLMSPIIIGITSYALGLRGNLFRVAIVQAALPQGIVPFVFAKEYECHEGIICPSVILGTAVAIPITIIYYIILGVKL